MNDWEIQDSLPLGRIALDAISEISASPPGIQMEDETEQRDPREVGAGRDQDFAIETVGGPPR